MNRSDFVRIKNLGTCHTRHDGVLRLNGAQKMGHRKEIPF